MMYLEQGVGDLAELIAGQPRRSEESDIDFIADLVYLDSIQYRVTEPELKFRRKRHV